MAEIRGRYHVVTGELPVEEMTEEERQHYIRATKRQIELYEQQLEDLKTGKIRTNAAKIMIGGPLSDPNSKESIMRNLEREKEYLARLTKKERTKEMFDLLTTDPDLNEVEPQEKE